MWIRMQILIYLMTRFLFKKYLSTGGVTAPSFFMLKIVTYTMYLITITDIETKNIQVHRLVFDNHKECVRLAEAVNQVRDPISTKKNCRSVISYFEDLP